MTDPVTQAIDSGIAFIRSDSIAAGVALVVGLFWAYILYRRIGDSTDPSIRKTTSSALGSSVMLVSGAYLSAALAGAIMFVTWPLALQSPGFTLFLVGGVGFHAAMEYREDKT